MTFAVGARFFDQLSNLVVVLTLILVEDLVEHNP